MELGEEVPRCGCLRLPAQSQVTRLEPSSATRERRVDVGDAGLVRGGSSARTRSSVACNSSEIARVSGGKVLSAPASSDEGDTTRPPCTSTGAAAAAAGHVEGEQERCGDNDTTRE